MDEETSRFGGVQRPRLNRRMEKLRGQVRRGFVLGLGAKRILRRCELGGKTSLVDKRPKTVTQWLYDGHSGESPPEKVKKKVVRIAAGRPHVRYIRGLRVLQDMDNTKFVDRDVMGSINIGIVWLGDYVIGFVRPTSFIRPQRRPGRR